MRPLSILPFSRMPSGLYVHYVRILSGHGFPAASSIIPASYAGFFLPFLANPIARFSPCIVHSCRIKTPKMTCALAYVIFLLF